MATKIKSIVRFTNVAVGATVVLPHGLAVSPPGGGDLPVTPDVVTPNRGGFTVTADDTNVTVTNNTGVVASLDVLCESWHSLERDFGAASIEALTPQPFVLNLDAGGGAALGSVIQFGLGTLVVDVANILVPGYESVAEGGEIADIAVVMPRAGTLRNLFVRHNGVGSAAAVATYEVKKNGVVDAALTAALACDAVGQASDLVGSIVVAQGDRIGMTATVGETGGGQVAAVATMLLDD